MTTRAPSATKRSTVARPMPLPPPVTMATLPASSSDIGASLACGSSRDPSVPHRMRTDRLGHVDKYYDIKVNQSTTEPRRGRRSHDRARTPRSPIPREGFGAPKDRTGARPDRSACRPAPRCSPPTTTSRSSEDIFYERFPDVDEGPGAARRLRRRRLDPRPSAARPSCRGSSPPCSRSTTRWPAPPRTTSTPGSRELESDGVHRELAFPNALLGLMGWPDKEVRELCFRIYNEHIAELQERSNGRFYGVGIINWWDGDGCRRTLDRAEGARPEDVLDAAQARRRRRRQADRLQQHRRCTRVWEAIEESGLPVAHHIGEAPLASPCRDNGVARRDGAQRRAVPRDVRPLRVRRHPRPPPRPAGRLVRGRHQLGPGRAPGRRAPVRVAPAHGRPRDRARRRRTTGSTTCTPRSWSTRSGSS